MHKGKILMTVWKFQNLEGLYYEKPFKSDFNIVKSSFSHTNPLQLPLLWYMAEN